MGIIEERLQKSEEIINNLNEITRPLPSYLRNVSYGLISEHNGETKEKVKPVCERKLLYYDRVRKMPKHWDGSPIHQFRFIDVKSGEEVILGQCFENRRVSFALSEYYYSDILDASQHYDLLWKVLPDRITYVTETFEEVQGEYKRLVHDGISPDKINEIMMGHFNVQEKSYTK